MKLKNSQSESKNTFDKIQKILAAHGAKRISYEYNIHGKVIGLTFEIEINGKSASIKLPARLENVSRIMFHGLLSEISESKRDQVYRTAWANIRDWIDAQMAMIDTNMVVIEEIFMPYLYDPNRDITYFEHVKANPKLLLMDKN